MPLTTKLRRFFLTVTKDFSATDNRQVPASALAVCFRQGATVNTDQQINISVGGSANVPVYDAGRIQQGDMVIKDANFTISATVSSVPDRKQINLASVTGGTLTLNRGDRLVPTSVPTPSMYSESTGKLPISNSVPTEATTGILKPSYSAERFVDSILFDQGTNPFSPRLLVDQPTGHSLRAFDVRDFGGNIQAVLDIMAEPGLSDASQYFPSGGILYLPRGKYFLSDTLKVRRGRVIIQGEGLDTRLVPLNLNKNVIELVGDDTGDLGAHDFTMRDLMIDTEQPTPSGTGHGIYCQGSGGYRPPRFTFQHVQVFNMGGDAVHLENCDFPLFLDCGFNVSGQSGVSLKNTAQAAFIHCYSQRNKQYGLYVEGGDLYWQGVGIENNGASLPSNAYGGQVRLKNCISCVITRTDIESFGDVVTQAAARNGIVVESSRGVVISGCNFFPNASTAQIKATTTGVVILKEEGATAISQGIQVVGNLFSGIGKGVSIPDSVSCVDVMLASNGTKGGNASAFKMYAYPTGAAADGLRLCVWGSMDDPVDKTKGQVGLSLPVFITPPIPTAENEGMIAYHQGALRGARLKISDGQTWWPAGSAMPFVNASDRPDPATVGSGTLIYVINDQATPVDKRLQVCMGTTGSKLWKGVTTFDL